MNRAKKMESKRRWQKAIIGIAIAAIMLATLMAMAPTVSAKDITSNYLTTRNGYQVNPAFVLIEITEGDTDTIKIGQLIIFANAKGGDTVRITGIPDTNRDGEAFSASTFVTETEEGEPVDILYFDTTSMSRTGPYTVICGALSQAISISNPTIPLELKVGPNVVSTIAAGNPLRIDCPTSLDSNDCVDLLIIDPKGRQVKTWTLDGKIQKFDEINVAQLMEYGSTDPAKQIDTTDWILGTYRFSVVTEWENARGLDLLSETKTLQVLKGEVDIDVDMRDVVELEPVTVTMAGIYGHTIHVESTAGRAFVEFEEGPDDFAATYDRKYGNSGCYGFDVVMEGDGQMQFPVRFHDTGAYEIEATDLATYDEDAVVVIVSGKEVTFDMPSTIAIGENLTFKGSANAGDYIDIAIDDYIVKQSIPIAEDGTFEANLPTPVTPGTGSPGAIKIEAFIRLADEPAFSGDVSDVEDAGSAKLFMQNDAGGGIDIAASDANIGKNETIIITVDAIAGHNVSVTSADPLHTVFEYNRYDFTGTSNNIIIRVPTDTLSIPADIEDCDSQADAMNIHGVWKMMGGDGVRKFELHFTDVGTYKITATDYGTGYPTATRLDEESIEIIVAEKNVTFNVHSIVVIGDRITIRGTANAGDYIDIAIDDYIVYVGIPIEADGTFEADLPTPETRGTGALGLIIRIEAFTRIAGEPPLSGDVSGVEDDGYAEVFLVGPWLTASLSTDTVDLEDNFTISGTASGSDFVDIVTVAPRGGAGRGINPASVPDVPGITYDSSAVSDIDDSYLKELYVDEDADTGKYLVVVLSPGPNGVYDELNSLDLFGSAFEAGYGDIRNLGAKTQEQILAIIADATVDAAGSDDLLWVGTIVIKG
ncbi:hypothetical protein C5S53_11435 [Methanophagales archaeon]|nr:hypothetical protein C5S53_11435 [Methanophagales archaeon]